MIKNTISFFFILILMSSCGSNKIKLEDHPLINITEAYYTKWVSGVKGGGAGLNVHLSIDKGDIDKELIGLYYRKNYTSLKFNKPNIYTGFIRTSKKEETNLDLPVKKENIKLRVEKEYKLPFSIKENEAIVVALINKKKKYFIIAINKKQTLDFPQ